MAVEAGRILFARGRGIEVGHQPGLDRITDIQDAETALVVRLVHQVSLDVQVVIAGLVVGDVFRGHNRVVEVGQVPDQRPGSLYRS